MKIIGHRVPSLLYVAAIIGIFAAGSTVFSQPPAQGKFDGSYHGMYSGSFADNSATGTVAFSVANGAITVTDPGQGKGTVSSSGATTFNGSLGMGNVTCKFVGTFQLPAGKAHASGTWTCSGAGQTGKGKWSADQQ